MMPIFSSCEIFANGLFAIFSRGYFSRRVDF
jgi:hypothetical protein